jgi:pimeloyl-ACP methyl ester carboxylesterase
MHKKTIFIFIILLVFTTACNSNEPPTSATATPADAYPANEQPPATPLPPDSYPAVGRPTITPIPEGYPADETTNEEDNNVSEPESTEADANRPTLTPPPPEPEVDTATEPNATQPNASNVTINANDGLEIQGTYAYPGGIAPYPGVMLLHMLGSNRAIWQETGVMDALLLNGYAVLAIDMRGHGDTGGSQDWALAEDDLLRVWDFFVNQPEVDGEKTAVIGASIGANMGLVTAVNQPAINTVILLSPGLDYRGVTTDDQIPLYGERPIFIAASSEDAYAADSSQQLHDLAQGQKQLQLYDGAGHGTTMFNHEPELTALILEWLKQNLDEQ